MHMKAWLVISMFYQYYHSRCWWMENYHKYCYFARPLKANREPRSAYLPDGEAILIICYIRVGDIATVCLVLSVEALTHLGFRRTNFHLH